MLINLAIRNIGRNRRRTILAIVSVALALMLIVFMQGWIGGIMGSIVKNYTKNETGHIRIASAEFEQKAKFMPVTDNLDNPEGLVGRILSDEQTASQIALVAPRVTFGVLLDHGGKNLTAMALAGDPEKEKQLLMLQHSLLPGSRYLQGPKETIVGQMLAERLDYKLGDTLKIVTSGSDYSLRLKKARIVGIFKTGINQLDESVFQLPLDDARELLGLTGQSQQLIVMLKDWRKSELLASRIRGLIPDTAVAVTPWTKIGGYYGMVRMSETIYRFMYLVIAFLGAFIISNIMMMVVLERRKEIGILKSMGMTRRQILALFLTEGMVLGFAGSLIGTALGWLIVVILGQTGVDLTAMMSSMKMPMDNVVYPRIGILSILGSLCLGTLVSALVSLLPSRQAARMNAVEAIKSV